MNRAGKFNQVADILSRGSAPGGFDGGAHDPCLEDAARIAKLSMRDLHKNVGDYKAWDKKLHRNGGREAIRRLRAAANREGGCRQKEAQKQAQKQQQDAAKARQHPCLAPSTIGRSGRMPVRALLAALLILLVIAVVVHYAALILLVAELLASLVAFAAAVWAGHAVIEPVWEKVIDEPNWGYALTWVKARRAERHAITAKQAEWLEAVPEAQPIALGSPITAAEDAALKDKWATPRREYVPEPHYIRRDQR